MKYFVEIDGKRIEVVREGEEVRVDGSRARPALLTSVEGSPVLSISLGSDVRAVHRLTVRRDGVRGRYVLTIDGRRYRVEVLNERERAIRDMALAREGPAGPQKLIAPMPGLVVRVQVAAGDQVEAGQGLVVMEAMKMENELRATAAGAVKAVHAKPGEAVEKGALLVEFS